MKCNFFRLNALYRIKYAKIIDEMHYLNFKKWKKLRFLIISNSNYFLQTKKVTYNFSGYMLLFRDTFFEKILVIFTKLVKRFHHVFIKQNSRNKFRRI